MVTKPKYRKTKTGYEVRVGEVQIFVRKDGIFVIGAVSNKIQNEQMECSCSMNIAQGWKV